MVMLVSLNQASEHLRRDTTDDDADLALKIKAASLSVVSLLGDAADFLDSSGEPDWDSAGDPVGVPENVQIAVLLIVQMLYDGKTDEWKLANMGVPDAAAAFIYHAGRMPNLS